MGINVSADTRFQKVEDQKEEQKRQKYWENNIQLDCRLSL